MIQAINPLNVNNYKKQNTSFKQNESTEFVDYESLQKQNKRPSKAMQVAGFLGREFVGGVIVSAVLDGATNIFRIAKNSIIKNKIAKNPALQESLSAKIKPLIGIKQATKNAGIWGAFWVLVSTVFATINSAIVHKKQQV